MSMRRFTRLTNAFSQEGREPRRRHRALLQYYNFGRIHQALRVTPAIQGGAANHVCIVEEIFGLLD